jgi:urea transport system substrate-binding protein
MKRIYLLNAILIIGLLVFYFFQYSNPGKKTPIPVGVLFSITGSMAQDEKPVQRATLLAIEEINQQGGIDGHPLKPIVYDSASDLKAGAVLAKKMIVSDHVKVIFGCWTSAARKEVKPVVEQYDNLLIYSTQYEGAETSPNIIYLGTTPNQQLIPAVSWMMGHFGKTAYLVGSDYIFPHVANEILKHEVKTLGGTVLGTHYLPLGTRDVMPLIKDILAKKPAFILNTINGSSNIDFFNRLYEETVKKGIPRPIVMSFRLSPGVSESIGLEKMIGDLMTVSYDKDSTNINNRAFLTAYEKKYGTIARVSDSAITSYAGVYLWRQAVRLAPSDEPAVVREFILGQSTASPAGVIYIDPSTGHAWRMVDIMRINQQGHVQTDWTSFVPIQPIVYPYFKTRAEWSIFEYLLNLKWHGSWGGS